MEEQLAKNFTASNKSKNNHELPSNIDDNNYDRRINNILLPRFKRDSRDDHRLPNNNNNGNNNSNNYNKEVLEDTNAERVSGDNRIADLKSEVKTWLTSNADEITALKALMSEVVTSKDEERSARERTFDKEFALGKNVFEQSKAACEAEDCKQKPMITLRSPSSMEAINSTQKITASTDLSRKKCVNR